MRRGIDLVAAASGLLLSAPLLLLLWVVVRLDSAGPAIFAAERIGRGGLPFRMFKFRTMRIDGAGPRITRQDDERITRVGRWLRRTKLDELPQLFNVLRGEMGLVGPRPEDPRYVELYDAEQRRVLDVRPGLTSAASLRFRDESSLLTDEDWERSYVDRVLPAKLAIELDYLEHRNVRSDLTLVLQTIGALPRPPATQAPRIRR